MAIMLPLLFAPFLVFANAVKAMQFWEDKNVKLSVSPFDFINLTRYPSYSYITVSVALESITMSLANSFKLAKQRKGISTIRGIQFMGLG